MKLKLNNVKRRLQTPLWWAILAVVIVSVGQVVALNGPNVCLVNQKYNITKRIKYRAPMAVRTYEWCLAIPPRCSRWNTVMKDLTRLETEERTAEVSVCCPGYRMRQVSCVPICPHGKTGPGCSMDCAPRKWGPNCVHDCQKCSDHGVCSPTTGECRCQDGWQGESCESSMSTEATINTTKDILTSTNTPTTNVPITSTPGPVTIITTSKGTTTSSIRTTIQETTLTPSVKTTIPTTTKDITSTASAGYSNSTVRIWTSTFNEPYIENTRSYQIGIQKVPKFSVTDSTFSTSKNHMSSTTPRVTNVTSATSTTKLETKSTTSSLETRTKQVSPNMETTQKQETPVKTNPTTVKFKPKEIWIKPAQKGESTVVDTKIRPFHEPSSTKHRNTTKKDHLIEMTTPRTIIVAIIPTSMSYPSFKKISLTTASTLQTRYKTQNNTPESHATTRPIANQSLKSARTTNHSTPTMKPFNIKHLSTVSRYKTPSTVNLPKIVTTSTTNTASMRTTKPVYTKRYTTNSMASMINDVNTKSDSIQHNYASTFTVPSNKPSLRKNVSLESTTAAPMITTKLSPVTENTTDATKAVRKTEIEDIVREYVKQSIVRKEATNQTITTAVVETIVESTTNTNREAKYEERFDILTEPEHITAMGDKTERASMDLVSVMSIAGGVMMVVITMAVVIVMMDRCRRRSYDDLKMNNIHMKVVMESEAPPPPYARSIFHTPLPDPPMMDKCHYQPISTLDRNLKQFMRPVVVQNISPLMLENFRGILECHYDHLPRRSQDFRASQCDTITSSLAPSLGDYSNSLSSRAHSITDSTIEALKCEAKLEVLDSTTSEPLYAEIPAWRPPSEHAIEIVNMNGEAVTEL